MERDPGSKEASEQGLQMKKANRGSILIFVVIALILSAAIAIRAARDESSSSKPSSAAAVEPASAKLVDRRQNNAVLQIPSDWQEVEKTEESTAWSNPEGTHTVTLVSTESGADDLRTVAELIRTESEQTLEGEHEVGKVRSIRADEDNRFNEAVMLPLWVKQEGERMDVAQVWVRDQRASYDAIATWTSTTGKWVLDPEKHLPRIDAQ